MDIGQFLVKRRGLPVLASAWSSLYLGCWSGPRSNDTAS